MGAQRAAWQGAFTAEQAALTKLDLAEGLVDLVKAFETVPHYVLTACALALGYPLIILRLCMTLTDAPAPSGSTEFTCTKSWQHEALPSAALVEFSLGIFNYPTLFQGMATAYHTRVFIHYFLQ